MSLDFSWIIPYVPLVLSVVNLLVLGYSLKLNRDSVQLKNWAEMLQHSNLLIKLEGITALQISLTNVGNVPIDKIEMKVEGVIQKESKPNFFKEYTSKTILSEKDTSNIPLFRDLEQYLLNQKMIGIHYEESPTEERDPITDETIFVKEKFTHIVKPFSMDFSLKTIYTVHKATKTIPKEFVVSYNYVPEYGDPAQTGDPECRYCDNFDVSIQEIQWSS